MITYHHEPTNTTVETTSGNISGQAVTSGTPWLKMQLRTKYVDTSITRYDSHVVGPWSSQSIHLKTSDDVHAEVVSRPESIVGRYVVVRLDHHDTVFVPIEIADAIVGAVLDEAIYAEEEAS